jgi:hypothetical protein
VEDVGVVKQLIEEANHRRSVGSTAANADSSRSHSIMQFALKRYIAGGAASRLVSGSDCAGSDAWAHSPSMQADVLANVSDLPQLKHAQSTVLACPGLHAFRLLAMACNL